MADDKRDPPNTVSGAKRRRPPATLDLKATEIASAPVTPEPTDLPPEKPVDPTAPSVAAAAETARDETPRDTPEPAESLAVAGHSPEPETPAAPPLGPESAAAQDNAGPTRFRLIAAAASGVLVALCVALGLWVLAGPGSQSDQADRLTNRITALEMQVRDATKPQPAGGDSVSADLAARLDKAEQATAWLADLDARLAKLEQAPARAAGPGQSDKTLIDRVAALETTLGPRVAAATAALAADHQQIEALGARIAALEQAATGIDERIARAAATGADKAGRLAYVTQALRSAVERGDPFAIELATVKQLGGDPALLGPLEPFAASGVPRPAALARELSQLTGPMLAGAGASAPAREIGIMDRLQQGAERLVRIRPINETPGDDPATVISRADVKATNGDLPGALAELARLPEAARAPANTWIKKADAQAAALGAVRRLADNAAAGLARP